MSEKNKLVLYKEEKILEDQVDDTAKELSKQIAKTTNSKDLDPLYDAFKINDAKKNIFRINKLNNLLDKVTDEAVARFENRPGEMSNKEVIDYMNAVQNQIDKSKSTVEQNKNINLTQVNNNVNIHVDNKQSTLDRDSRERIIDFIKEVLNSNSTSDNNVIDVTSDIEEGEDNQDD